MLKKCPSDTIIISKNALFFRSQAPTHPTFTFNLQFLRDKLMVHLSETVLDFPFSISSHFY